MGVLEGWRHISVNVMISFENSQKIIHHTKKNESIFSNSSRNSFLTMRYNWFSCIFEFLLVLSLVRKISYRFSHSPRARHMSLSYACQLFSPGSIRMKLMPFDMQKARTFQTNAGRRLGFLSRTSRTIAILSISFRLVRQWGRRAGGSWWWWFCSSSDRKPIHRMTANITAIVLYRLRGPKNK